MQNVILITGASSGIGRALALQLAREGAKLALSARTPEPLERVAAECREAGAEAIAIAGDVGVYEDCVRMVCEAVEHFGRLDMLIANAGISMRSRFEDITDPTLFERIMRINYFGAAWCTMAALPELKKTSGRIVAMSSLTGKTGVPFRTAYAASKHAMAGFFESLRLELIGSGVSVTTIYPGFVTSDIRLRALGPDGTPVGSDAQNEDADMSAEECARITLDAARKRKREVVMTARAKVGMWLKIVSPAMVDRITLNAVRSRMK